MNDDDGDTTRPPEDGPARPTMSDVAALAGVSLKTVSRVINAEPSVRPETAERVMVAVRELGFRRNVVAADFARGASRREIGLVIDDVSNPFWAQAARAIEDAATVTGRHVMTASSDFRPEREHEIIDSFVGHRLGGLIVVPVGRDHSYLADEVHRGTAIVFIDRPQSNLDADTVLTDDYGGARRAVEHLMAHGHRRIALVAQPLDIYTMVERHRAYRDALADVGLPQDLTLERLAEGVEGAETAARELLALPDPPTAIFSANNRVSVGVIRGLGAERQRVAMVGFDEVELADALEVPLTVVRTDATALGRGGAELLLRRMSGWNGEPQRIDPADGAGGPWLGRNQSSLGPSWSRRSSSSPERAATPPSTTGGASMLAADRLRRRIGPAPKRDDR